MKIQIDKSDAAALVTIEKEIRETEFRLMSLNSQRTEILNGYFEKSGLLPLEGDWQISSPPDWSEMLVMKK